MFKKFIIILCTIAATTLAVSGGGISTRAYGDDEDPNQGLRDLTDLVVGIISTKLSTGGVEIDLTQYIKEDTQQRALKIGANEKAEILKKFTDAGVALKPVGQLFFNNLVDLSFTHDLTKKELHIGLNMTEWTGLKIKDSKDAKKNELIGMGIPKHVSYTVTTKGKNVKIAADTPRKDNALRLVMKGAPGNLWFREIRIDFEKLQGEINLGAFGNVVGILAKFKLNSEAAPGESPISIKPELWKIVQENSGALLFLPLLVLLF